MIHANVAEQIAQERNRNMWIKAASEKLSKKIKDVASQGKRQLQIDYEELIQGAENLEECATMLNMFKHLFETNGYKHEVKPNGSLFITW